jgi:hypothetical protein
MPKRVKRTSFRSGGMLCPICNRKHALIEHHIHGREIPNAEAQWNKCRICAACHDDIHIGTVIIEGWFMTTGGEKLVWRRAGEPPKLAEGAKPPLYSPDSRPASRNGGA